MNDEIIHDRCLTSVRRTIAIRRDRERGSIIVLARYRLSDGCLAGEYRIHACDFDGALACVEASIHGRTDHEYCNGPLVIRLAERGALAITLISPRDGQPSGWTIFSSQERDAFERAIQICLHESGRAA